MCVCVCARARARVCVCVCARVCVCVRVSLSLSLSLCVCGLVPTNAVGGSFDLSTETVDWIKRSKNLFYAWHFCASLPSPPFPFPVFVSVSIPFIQVVGLLFSWIRVFHVLDSIAVLRP